MVSILLKKYRSWWKIIHVHHLDLGKIHTHVAGCPDPSRLTPKTGPIFYVTCTVLTVDWTKIVTFTAIHTRHFTAFIEVYETINYVKNLGFLIVHSYITFWHPPFPVWPTIPPWEYNKNKWTNLDLLRNTNNISTILNHLPSN